jgi:hypothetical protein
VSADKLLSNAKGFERDEPGDPRSYHQNIAAGVNDAIKVISAREAKPQEGGVK